jgi:hypothetical protein
VRAALTIIAVVALCATPVAAQGKTKAKASAGVAVLEMCERIASGDVLAVQAAQAQGWDAYEDAGESPFVKSYTADKAVPGVGEASLFALIESYPESSFGYCRVDVDQPEGGNELVQAIADLPRYAGETRVVDDGLYASLVASDKPNWLLLSHRNADSFVIQLSINTPKAATEQ